MGAPGAWLLPALIVLAGLAAYGNSLGGAFVFDDRPWIVENEDIRVLWPPSVAMGLSFRPLVFYSLAVNYAVSGLEPWSYHAVNLALHLAAALALFGLLRRGLSLPRVGMAAGRARIVAFSAAIIWSVHPLNTQAVVYVIQRAEVMAGLAYLLTAYCFVRAVGSADARAALRWHAGVVVAFYTGLVSKEIVATAPLTIYLLDAVVASGSFAAPIRRRWKLYAAMGAPFVLGPAYWLLTNPERFVLLTPDASTPSALDYLWGQGRVIVEYLRLTVWPTPLNLDRGWTPAHHAPSLASSFALVVALFLGALEATRRCSPIGFVALTFFVLLAPTSSFFPLADYMVEHRMYLALIPCITLVVLAVDVCVRKIRGALPMRSAVVAALLLAAVAPLIAATAARNAIYRSRTRLWADVVAKSPHHARAHFNLGLALLEDGPAENQAPALSQFLAAVALRPSYAEARNNIGSIYLERGLHAEALEQFESAIATGWDPIEVLSNRASTLLAMERFVDAIPAYERALKELSRERGRKRDHRIDESGLRNNLGVCYSRTDQWPQAIAEFQRAVDEDPELIDAHANLVRGLVAVGRIDEAIVLAQETCAARPTDASHRLRLARVLANDGQVSRAVEAYVHAMSLDGSLVPARAELTRLCADPDTRADTERALADAVARDPADAEVRGYLEMTRQLR